MNFFSQFIKRIGSQTPAFFKTVLTGATTLGGVGAAVLTVSAAGVALPATLVAIAGYAVAAGAAAAVVAKSATVDPKLQIEGGSNVVVNKAEGTIDTVK